MGWWGASAVAMPFEEARAIFKGPDVQKGDDLEVSSNSCALTFHKTRTT